MLRIFVRSGAFAVFAAIFLLGACGNDVDTPSERAPEIDRSMLEDDPLTSEESAEARVSRIRSGGLSRDDIVNEIDAAMLQSTRRIDAATARADW